MISFILFTYFFFFLFRLRWKLDLILKGKCKGKCKSINFVCFNQILVVLCVIFLTAYENPSVQAEKINATSFYGNSRSIQFSNSENFKINNILLSDSYTPNDYFKYIYQGLTLIYFRKENDTTRYEPVFFSSVNYTTGRFSCEPSNRRYYFLRNNELDGILLDLWLQGDNTYEDFYGSAKYENKRECYCIRIPHPSFTGDSSYLVYDYYTGILVEEYIESENLLVKLYLWSNWPLIISSDVGVIFSLIFLIGIPLLIGNIKQIKSKITPKISFLIIEICLSFSVFALIFLGLTWKATSTLPVIIEILILSAGIYFLSSTSNKQTSDSDFEVIFSYRQKKWLQVIRFIVFLLIL